MAKNSTTAETDPALVDVHDAGARLRWARQQIRKQNERMPLVDHNGQVIEPPTADSTSA